MAARGKPEWRTRPEQKTSAPAAAEEVQAAPAHAMPAAAAADGNKAAATGAGRSVDHNRPTDQTEEARANHFAAAAIYLGAGVLLPSSLLLLPATTTAAALLLGVAVRHVAATAVCRATAALSL